MKIINTHLVLLAMVLAVGLASCGKSGCPLKTYEPKQLIKAYHYNYFPPMRQSNAERFAIYLDYSGSMKTAFKDANTANFYQLFINSLKISTVDFYEVNNFSIDKIENLDKSQLYKKIKEAARFKGDNAPLNTAVKDIVNRRLAAVFITDGELWENGERDDPWAREEFERWLRDGNTIEFFITDHPDAGKQKHIFYICFVPKNSNNNVAADFKFYLQNSIEAKNYAYTHFAFTANAAQITKDYSVTTGGANENAGVDETAFVNGDSFEFVPIMNRWKDLYKYIGNSYDQNGNPVPDGAPLLSRLNVDLSKMEFYTVKTLDIKVSNVTADFNRFNMVAEVKANPPTFVTDEKGEPLLDENRLPIISCPGHYEGYSADGKLIYDTVFKPTPPAKFIPDLFKFDEKHFAETYNTTKKGEVCIKLNSNFSETGLSNTDFNLLRIDLILSDVSVNSQNANLDKFIWEGKQVKQNRSMYNSILGALNAANPKDKVIYTYYLYTLPY